MVPNEAYFLAKKKIEQARSSGAKELNLEGLDLTELPAEIWDLAELKVLNLGYFFVANTSL